MNERINTAAGAGALLATVGSHYPIPKEPGKNSALVLAGLMHVLLFLFLWIGIRWQSQEPVGVEAEIWDMTTREAAPLPTPEVAPPPAPVEVEQKPPEPTAKQIEQEQEADIAIERAKEKKLQEKKLQEDKERMQKEKDAQAAKERQQKEDLAKELKKKEDQAKEAKKQEQDKLAQQKKADALAQKQRDDNLKRLTGQIIGSGGNGDAVKSTGNNRVDPSYAGKIAAKIKSNMVYVGSDNGPDNPTVEFKIELFPDGSIKGVPQKTKSSGVAAFDDAVDRAIRKSAPFPADKSGNVPATIPLTYRLKD